MHVLTHEAMHLSGRLGEALMPDGYRSPDCRAGGAMDGRLAGAPWLAPARS